MDQLSLFPPCCSHIACCTETSSYRRAWDKEHKLVIGIDIGTTCSAVSYVHLTRGAPITLPLLSCCLSLRTQGTKPEIQHVTEWPGQSGNDRQCKLPSWVWYDSDHKVGILIVFKLLLLATVDLDSYLSPSNMAQRLSIKTLKKH